MAKKIVGMIKLQLPAGKATPAPPVGPALGQHGVNIMAFCKEFNAKTADKSGLIIPVVISVYQDKSFSFIMKTPPAAVLLINKVREIAELKFDDLNASNIDSAMDMICGTARSMGIEVENN